jgi:dUTP pyrophosphatase
VAVSAPIVRVLRLADVPMPARQTAGAAGWDLCAAAAATVPARGFITVGTGIALELPPGFEAQVRPRSGLASRHGIGILNSPGTVDSDYRGEVRVILFNQADTDYHVQPGDRIAQFVISRVTDVEIVEAERLDDTERGAGGFGHTGRA